MCYVYASLTNQLNGLCCLPAIVCFDNFSKQLFFAIVMSMDYSSQLNSTDEPASLSMLSAAEESSLFNNNVKLSNLDISLPTEEETLVEDSVTNLSPKLSVTMDQEERELLAKKKGRNIRSDDTVLKTLVDRKTRSSTKRDQSLNGSKIESRHSDKSCTEDSKAVDEDGTDDDDSVIPVEDEITDESTLQTSFNDQTSNAGGDMFSHLQPTSQQQQDLRAIDEGAGLNEESCIEEDQSQILVEENNLFKHSFIELGRRLWKSTDQMQCYTKGCLWSPDGTCLLVPVHMDGMHVMELPTDLYTTQELDTKRELSSLNTAVHVKEGGMVYDYSWYPFMNSTDPATCCWLATRQHEPIHMWDAFTGELRCSYRGYDEVDEVESAISVAFSNDGQKLVGGYKKSIKIFDTNIPGRDYVSVPVKQTVSCFAFTNENDNCVTTGSWNNHIYHYDLRAPKLGPLFTLGEHTGGVTWLKYSCYNTDNWFLFSGARRDDRILKWDMRNYQHPVKVYNRTVSTNQRIYFDFSPLQKWLISGDTKGLLRIWDTDDIAEQIQIPLHDDCCNGVSFHPSLPIISTSSGQYHFTNMDEESEKPSNADIEKKISYENSVVFLWFGPSTSI
ncbi:telomerase Cajal body protein 1 homolog [Haematobia irritans]|uniref:telomerase Cajal body protein 1 homolog n=1 Tax=Haematobia irritans TaxID=7368 RepID=UPI003F50CB29